MGWVVEHTDTFGGEANYCWVRRYKITPAKSTQRSIVRAAKAAAGFTGVRCEISDYGDSYTIRPRNHAQIMFVTWEEDEEDAEQAPQKG